MDRTEFLRREPRLLIARFCRDVPRTRQDIANHLKRPLGGVTSINTMLGAHALEELGTRGRAPLLRLNQAWVDALDLVARRQAAGVLSAGQDLLLISAADVGRSCEVLRDEVSGVRWALPLAGGQLGLLIGLDGADFGAAAFRLLTALAGANITAMRMNVASDPLEPGGLRDWAHRLGGQGQRLESGEQVDPL